MLDGNIMSLFDGKCLDYHTGTRNVYMHECHDGANQKWYWDEDWCAQTALRFFSRAEGPKTKGIRKP